MSSVNLSHVSLVINEQKNVTGAGEEILFKIIVTNDGNINLTNVTILELLNDTYLEGPYEISEEFGEVLDDNQVLEVGKNWIYYASYFATQEDMNTNGGGYGFINNTVTVSGDQLEQKSNSTEANIEQNPSYSIQKYVSYISGTESLDITKVGDVINYYIDVFNDGNVDLTNVTVNDSLINLSGPEDLFPEFVDPGESGLLTGF